MTKKVMAKNNGQTKNNNEPVTLDRSEAGGNALNRNLGLVDALWTPQPDNGSEYAKGKTIVLILVQKHNFGLDYSLRRCGISSKIA